MKASSTGARPEHSFAPVIGINGCVGHLIWTARGVRAFDADDKEVGTYATMDAVRTGDRIATGLLRMRRNCRDRPRPRRVLKPALNGTF